MSERREQDTRWHEEQQLLKTLRATHACVCSTNRCMRQMDRSCRKYGDIVRDMSYTRTQQRSEGNAQRDTREKKIRLRPHTVKEIPKANYAAAVLNSLDVLRSIMVHRHDPMKVQELAKAGLETIHQNIK